MAPTDIAIKFKHYLTNLVFKISRHFSFDEINQTLLVFSNWLLFVNETFVEAVNYGLKTSNFLCKICSNFQVDFRSDRLLLLEVALLKQRELSAVQIGR
jgi:hypothetical protein